MWLEDDINVSLHIGKNIKVKLLKRQKKNIATLECRYLFSPCTQNVKPEIPEYGSLNIHLKGYDYAVLESFSKYVHKVVSRMDLDTNW